MDKLKIYFYEKYTSFFDFCEKNKEKLEADNKFLELFNIAWPLMLSINKLLPVLSKTSTEETKRKKKLKKRLAQSCYNVCSALYTYAKLNDYEAFLNIKLIPLSKLENFSSSSLTTKANLYISLINENLEKSVEAGISAEAFEAFKSLLEEYKLVDNKPKEIIKERKRAKTQIDNNFKLLNAWLREYMDPYMLRKFKVQEPVFYSEYQLHMDFDSPSSHKYMMRGSVHNAITKEPLSKFTITIDHEHQSVRGGKQGGFNFSNIAPGKHHCRFELAGYETLETEINILSGKPYILNVEMRPISVNNN